MRKILLIFAVCFALLGNAVAQQTVTGIVTGDDGVGIPGVTVVENGTGNGTITDLDGAYSLIVSSDATLIFAFVGMQSVEEKVEGRSTIDVILLPKEIGIEEVLV